MKLTIMLDEHFEGNCDFLRRNSHLFHFTVVLVDKAVCADSVRLLSADTFAYGNGGMEHRVSLDCVDRIEARAA